MAGERAELLPHDMTSAAGRHLAAIMARAGLHDLRSWDSPDVGWIDPLNDPETKASVRSFLGRLFREAMERGQRPTITVNVHDAPSEPAGSFGAGVAAGYEEGRRRGR